MKKNLKHISFFSLIGGGHFACDWLNECGENIENGKISFSLSGARNNESDLLKNGNVDEIVYYDEVFADVECDCITCGGENWDAECKKIEALIADERYKDEIASADIVTAIPPCSALSALNPTASGKKDKSAQIMIRACEFAVKSKVKAFVLENAPRLYTKMGNDIRADITALALKYNYSVSFIKTNSILHGTGQKRERTFVHLWQSEYAAVSEYEIEHSIWSELIGGLVKDVNRDGETYSEKPQNAKQKWLQGDETILKNTTLSKQFNNRLKYFKKMYEVLDIDFASNVLEGTKITEDNIDIIKNGLTNLKNYDIDSDTSTKFKAFFERLIEKYENNRGRRNNEFYRIPENSGTHGVVGGNLCRMLHPLRDTILTELEAKRLMGIPDSFDVTKIVHITQNVPSFTFAAMIKNCIRFIENKLEISSEKELYQNIIQNNSKIN